MKGGVDSFTVRKDVKAAEYELQVRSPVMNIARKAILEDHLLGSSGDPWPNDPCTAIIRLVPRLNLLPVSAS